MKRNALLLKSTSSDSGSLVIKTTSVDMYTSAYEEIKSKLESPEMVQYIVDTNLMTSRLSGYKFLGAFWTNLNNRELDICLRFKSNDGKHIEEISFITEFVYVVE
jgi:hypothetical protein